MKFVVLDACVAVKWYVRENDSERAQQLIDAGILFLVPDVFFSEVANALRKHCQGDGQLDAPSVRLAVDDLLVIGIEPVSSTVLLPRATEIALALGHPIYDCLYLALAERWSIPFVTADERFCGKLAGSEWERHALLLAAIDQIA
jgi:predicted nucleic acid-binding protein